MTPPRKLLSRQLYQYPTKAITQRLAGIQLMILNKEFHQAFVYVNKKALLKQHKTIQKKFGNLE